jgi:site-specific recombinase XerC
MMTENLRDRVGLGIMYSGEVRVLELMSLNWDSIQGREGGAAQINVIGKRDRKEQSYSAQALIKKW